MIVFNDEIEDRDGRVIPSDENESASAKPYAGPHDATEAHLSRLFQAVRENQLTLARSILEVNPELWTSHDEAGHSLLHWVALLGDRQFVEDALGRGCHADECANNKQTPLMWAVVRGHVAVARTLIDAKANIRTTDSLGATPLIIAAQHPSDRRYQLMLELLERGKSLAWNHGELFTDVDYQGCTMAHWAAYKGDLTALKLIVEFEADLQVLDNEQMLPLHRAVYGGQTSVIPYLLQSRSDPLQQARDGRDCFEMAENSQVLLNALSAVQDATRSQVQSVDAVETLLGNFSASWLVPYYHAARSIEFPGCQAPNHDQDAEVVISPSHEYELGSPYEVEILGPPGCFAPMMARAPRGVDLFAERTSDYL